MKDPYTNSKHIKPQDSTAKAPGSAKPPAGGRTPGLARASLKEIIQSAKYGEKDGIAENQAIDQILTLISQSYISKETIREALKDQPVNGQSYGGLKSIDLTQSYYNELRKELRSKLLGGE